MNKFRPFILAVTVILSAFIAYGLWSRPCVADSSCSGFSAQRVVADIEQISKNHHSVAHPTERAEVREYLVSRLNELGADTVKLFEYKDLTGPENKHVVYTFDATNVLAEFHPQQGEGSTSLLFVAHYDSRYSQPMPHQDTVWSYGAADDGYGVGVILETMKQVLALRSEWKQGVKVLFTDAEEVGMKGMKAMWEQNREQFEDVGMMINIEARGPWGPALLFETSNGNEKIMELYDNAASYPFTYSLTTVVYNFMPNFTDFTIVKEDIPGMNFSTVADINHYHTDLDNFSNINPKSIQHYGEQITPIAIEYLTNEQYADKDALRATSDTTNFTIPLLGLFNFSKGGYMWINIAVFVLFLLLLALNALRGKVSLTKVCSGAGITLLAAIGALVAGELVAFICAVASDVKFKPFGIQQGIVYDNAAMIATVALLAVIVSVIYLWRRRAAAQKCTNSIRESAKSVAINLYTTNKLYGALLLLCLLSIILLIALGENLMFFIPLTAATAALLLYRATRLKVWLLAAITITLLHAFSFLYALAMALTIGALGAITMLAVCDILILLPLSDLYCSKRV